MNSPVRIAVVGVGHLGRHHARVASSLAGVRCVGVYDHHEGRAEQVGREFGLPVLSSLRAVAQAADAVVIATPTVSHAKIAGELLDSGLDVLIEKPIAASLAEADDLLACAGRRGCLIGVGHVERHNPAVQAGLDLLSAPRFVEVHRLGVFTPRSLDVDVVLDLMIHDLQILRDLAGEVPVEIRAVGMPVLTPQLDIANARLAFPRGLVANLTASRVSAEKVRKCRIFAPSLYVSIDMQAQTVRVSRLDRGGPAPRIESSEVNVEKAEPLERELSDFADAVARRRPPLVSGENARGALALAELVREAIAEHRRAVEG